MNLSAAELSSRLSTTLLLWRSNPGDIALPGQVCSSLTNYLLPQLVEWIESAGGTIDETNHDPRP